MNLLMVLFIIVAVLVILIILIQRGRGGGLAGALGGAGGHSAFGTKTGDVFTKATAVLAGILILLAIIIGYLMHGRTPAAEYRKSEPVEKTPAEPGSPPEAPGEKTPAEPESPPTDSAPVDEPSAEPAGEETAE